MDYQTDKNLRTCTRAVAVLGGIGLAVATPFIAMGSGALFAGAALIAGGSVIFSAALHGFNKPYRMFDKKDSGVASTRFLNASLEPDVLDAEMKQRQLEIANEYAAAAKRALEGESDPVPEKRTSFLGMTF